MATELREFEVDRSVDMQQGLQIIRAALDDEGLALGPKTGPLDEVTSVIAGGRKVFRVPSTRIMTREDDRAMRASFAREDRR